MKKQILALLSLGMFSGMVGAQTKPAAAKPQNLELKVHVNGLTSGEMLLAHYYANQNKVIDTAKVDAKGNVVFKKNEPAPGGIYLVVFPSKRHFECIIADEQKFSLDVPDTNDIINSIKVTGSKENIAFYEYQRYMMKEQKKVEPLQAALKSAKERNNKDSANLITKQITEIDSAVKVYKRDFYKKSHPETFMAKVLSAMDEPDNIPYEKCPKKADGTIDSTYNYRNFKAHYWDGFDFNDERLIRTPVYYNKMKFWLEKLSHPHPDSVIQNVDWLIEKTRPSKELFKYTVSYTTYTYETSKIMGYDAIFVHIVNKYYKTNQCWWVSEENKAKVIKRSDQLSYTLLGKYAVNLMLKDTSDKPVTLQSVQGQYTVVIFWDPTCSHCKHDIPLLKAYYDSLNTAGIKFNVYAIYSEMDTPTWKKYIKDNKLNWVNVHSNDKTELGTAKYYYDVYSTPTLYLLDENKKIIGKRFDVENMKPFLNRKIEEDKKKAAGR